ncbi:DNA glycosylase [Violaceomyces palustris]|uniref:DNA glycosylase n=1 Tax=Violaceomyces palustris TaxID=1673888 RepID=A0ACD0NST8_9BASI|nr:DNA glycosylase [Violaceomyces palustris]
MPETERESKSSLPPQFADLYSYPSSRAPTGKDHNESHSSPSRSSERLRKRRGDLARSTLGQNDAIHISRRDDAGGVGDRGIAGDPLNRVEVVISRLDGDGHCGNRGGRTKRKSPAVPTSEKTDKAKKKKGKRIKRGVDDPNSEQGSKYSHLSFIPDHFGENLDIMFCGINPGVRSSTMGHHFSHPTNHFYPSLHMAGITARRMTFREDHTFPSLSPFSLGLTNLAPRPTAESGELTGQELKQGVPLLLEKVRKWRPKIVCFVGKGIANVFMATLKSEGHISSKRPPEVRTSKARSIKVEDAEVKELADDLESGKGNKQETEEGKPEKPKQNFVEVAVPKSMILSWKNLDDQPMHEATTEVDHQRDSQREKIQSYGLLPVILPHPDGDTGSGKSRRYGTLFFVTPSTSARVTTHFVEDKARIMKYLRLLARSLVLRDLGGEATVKKEEDDPHAYDLDGEAREEALETYKVALEMIHNM